MRDSILKNRLIASTILAGLSAPVWLGAAIAQEVVDEDVTVIEEVDEDDVALQEIRRYPRPLSCAVTVLHRRRTHSIAGTGAPT